MAEDDECDYMSEVFVSQTSDKRPGLAWGTNAKKYEKEKRADEINARNKKKPVRVVEKESRDRGLKTKLGDDNKGFAMLQKMGYKPGQGLGKNKSGRVDPVPIEVKIGKTGLGKDAHERRKREAKEKFATFLMQKRRKHNERLQVDFRARMSGKFADQQYEKDLRKSQKVCHQLQEQDGIERPEFDFFWPKELVTNEEDEDTEEDDEEEYSVEDKLYMITKYLRETYYYCLWCAVRYDDTNDLHNNCPGETAKDHDD